MSKALQPEFHTVGEEWLALYAAGGLTPAKRLVIDCQAAVEPRLNARLGQFDEIGGAFVETAKGEPLSEAFWSDAFWARLDESHDDAPETAPAGAKKDADGWMPAPLRDYLDGAQMPLNWKKSGPGVERAPLTEAGGERLYLLKARPGVKMPVHSHRGQEWTLILQGGYHIGDAGYARGDLHGEDETCTHQPIIDDDGEDCITLVVDEGKLVFSDPLMKILQPFIGV